MKIEEGTIEVIYNNQKQNPLFNKPVLQITSLQKIGNKAGEKFRYRANVSDGKFYMRAVFSSDLTPLFDSEKVDKYTLIKLNLWNIRALKDSNYIYIQQIEEYEKCNVEIGKSVNYETGKASLNETRSQAPNITENVKKSKISETENLVNTKVPRVKETTDLNKFTQINAINPFHKMWIIKGRIVSKSEIKKFNSKRGEGKLFSFEFADETGQIKVVAFSEVVDMFYPIIEIGRVYTIQKGLVKMSNKQFSNNNNDYEIHLDVNSEIEKVEDNETPKYFFDFVKIKDMVPSPNPVDVIGIVKDAGEAVSFVVKSTQKESVRRDITLIDETGSIRATFWGGKAEEEIEVDSVLAIKNIKVSDFGGLSLSSVFSSQLHKNPDIPESHSILGWYNEGGKDMKISLPERDVKISLISDVKNQEMPFSAVRATLMFIKEDNMMYDSCKEENCTKKVYKNEFEEYRCEKCDKTSYECNYRYLINANISDSTGQIWGTLFNDQALLLLGLSASDFREMADNDANQSQMFIKKFLYKDYIIKLRSRQDNYNDEIRMRNNITDIKEVNYKEEAMKDIYNIEKYLLNKN
ncbi:replication factor A protein 1 (RFA1) [Vairimorpha necatrix]|uniref:Replication protein A subunit n=1 Tax=Vairimorpha necatrix TaxID=6039 RepID=A0AAX4JDS7_9MICR